jgi:uncharacterized linocin/CFP29 family protein
VNHLLREAAPVTEAGWDVIDEEARRQLVTALAARKLVDFSGPRGWEHSATGLGRTEPLDGGPVEGVEGARRLVLPLVELRAPFSLSRAELADIDRGAEDPDLDALQNAARSMALAENTAVFQRWEPAGLLGIAAASPHDPIALGDDPKTCPRHVAAAVEALKGSGVGGPYGLALGPQLYMGVIETAEHGGALLFEHLRHILGGPLVWAPGVDGAVALSLRGGDFLLDCGQDLAVGYASHDAAAVHLYVAESFSFRVATPEAAVGLRLA